MPPPPPDVVSLARVVCRDKGSIYYYSEVLSFSFGVAFYIGKAIITRRERGGGGGGWGKKPKSATATTIMLLFCIAEQTEQLDIGRKPRNRGYNKVGEEEEESLVFLIRLFQVRRVQKLLTTAMSHMLQ